MSNDTLAKPAAKWAIGASGERLGAKMAKQSVFMFENHGNTFWADKSSAIDIANFANNAKKAFITKLTSTEIDFQAGTDKSVIKGIFELGSLNGTPATIWDLINNTNFINSAIVSSWLTADPTVNAIRIYSYTAPISISDFFCNSNRI